MISEKVGYGLVFSMAMPVMISVKDGFLESWIASLVRISVKVSSFFSFFSLTCLMASSVMKSVKDGIFCSFI